MSFRPALVALGLSFPVSRAAQSAEKPPLIMGQVGVIVLNLPAYPGSDERWTIPVPFLDLRVAQRFHLCDGLGGLSAGAGVYLVEAGGLLLVGGSRARL